LSPTVKFIIGGVVVAVVIGVLIGTSFSGSTSDYITVADARALGPDQSRDSRVAGAVVPDSVEWSTRNLHLTFRIEDETGILPISYYGPQPDMLVDGFRSRRASHEVPVEIRGAGVGKPPASPGASPSPAS
jgi:cytochrome c-type biogenesis protein CcmE